MQRTRPPFALVLVLVLVASATHAAVAAGGQPVDLTADGQPVDLTAGGQPADAAAGPAPVAAASVVATSEGSTASGARLFVIRGQSNTTNYLAIRDQFVETERYEATSLNVAGALAADARRARQEHAELTFRQRFQTAASAEARLTIVRNETRHIGSVLDALKQRQQRAITAFNAGDISTAQFLQRLATLDATARALEDRLRRLETVIVGSDFRLPGALDTRIDNLRAELFSLRGNVRARIGRTFAGRHSPETVYVQTSASGIVLTAVNESHVVREAYLAGRRRPDQPDTFAKGEEPRIILAHERASELYPWTYSIGAGPNVDGFGNSSVYRISHTHPHGRLVAFLDGGSTDIYRELQWKRLAMLPMNNVSKTNGTLAIRANYSHATGPMQVSLTDTATGQPVNATVYVNGHPVGTTGADGTLWTVAPYDGVRIEARTADDVINLNFFAEK